MRLTGIRAESKWKSLRVRLLASALLDVQQPIVDVEPHHKVDHRASR